MVPYWRLSVGLCFWQTGHSAVVIGRLALVKKMSHVVEPMYHLHPCYNDLFISLLGDDRDSQGKRLTYTHRMGHPILLLIKILLY